MASVNLSHEEWEVINRILLNLYTIQDLDRLTESFLSLLRLSVVYTSGSFVLLEPASGSPRSYRVVSSSYYGIEPKWSKLYESRYFQEDYMFGSSLFDQTLVLRDTDLLGHAMREKTPFYQEFLKPQGLIYGLGAVFFVGKTLCILRLFRNASVGDFAACGIYINNVFKDHLVNIIRSLQKPVSEESLSQLLLHYSQEHDILLTQTEYEIANLLLEGCSNKEIADKRCVAVSTIKKHVYNIFQKLDVKNRAQLVNLLNSTH